MSRREYEAEFPPDTMSPAQFEELRTMARDNAHLAALLTLYRQGGMSLADWYHTAIVHLARTTSQLINDRIEIEIAHGALLDAIAARLGVPPREVIMRMEGSPMESDATYRRRVLHKAGFQ